jgi:hypothetical protein
MSEAETLLDGETEFRRRLGVKLAARGYAGPALAAKLEELLRQDIPLRLRPIGAPDLPSA